MIAIVNVTPNWGIGKDGRLLVVIRDDLKRFRLLTQGKTVIYGRKTLSTFPGGKPLKNRRNLILTRRRGYTVEGAEVCRDLAEALEALADTSPEDVFVIGGESVYAQLLPHCERAYVTKTFADAPADSFFPDLDALPNWEQIAASEIMEENGIAYQYIDYVNRDVK
ncbi:MAG: dihydrofolate reductase [Oscillospiraceae bacterium]|nr:dihydrofolate reductase [Oscillospiraceae bacterium]